MELLKRDFTYEYIKPRRSSFLVYLKGDHVFTHRRKNIARSFRACNFLIITRQIFTDRLFLYRIKECSSKVSFLFITFIPECISRFRRIYNIYICDYRLRHVRIIIRFFFLMKSVSLVNYLDSRAFDYRGRWSASSKMAAFVAKQMVGNKLNAVKGEYFLRNRFQIITP